MITNKNISGNINQWNIEYDPYGFTLNEDWLKHAEKTEDILQLSHVYGEGPILDVGYYNITYKVFIIYNSDWNHPKEVFASNNIESVTSKIYEWIDKYANG